MKNKIEFIAFDADDTLWENELYFQELEHKFCHLLRKYSPAPSVYNPQNHPNKFSKRSGLMFSRKLKRSGLF